jgi:HD-GYP domain-containing protein (c-di-GMP phosphodiesterase class II)
MTTDISNVLTKEIPFFCALLINNDMGEKIKTEIVTSQFPIHVLNKLNERKKERAEKANRELKNDERWNIFLIIGPFKESLNATMFYKKWKKKTRGAFSRAKRGTKLASIRDLEVYVDSDSEKEIQNIIRMYKEFKNKRRKINHA